MSKGFSNEKFDEFKKIEGFDGPYRNLYLKGIALGKGSKIFDTLEEAIIAANDNDMCGGITVNRKGKYSLRRKSNLLNSDPTNRFKSIEITYVKKEIEKEEPKNKLVQSEPYIIEEYLKKDKNDDLFEVILYKNSQYYYNPNSKEVLDLQGYPIGRFLKGKIQN